MGRENGGTVRQRVTKEGQGNGTSSGQATAAPSGRTQSPDQPSATWSWCRLIIATLVITVTVAAAAVWIMLRPTYHPAPGGIAQADALGDLPTPLTPPAIESRTDHGFEIKSATANNGRQGYFHVSDGVKVYFRAVGRGSTPVLLVHGGPGAPHPSTGWAAVEALANGSLGEQFTFYYLHQRGCGRSTRPITDLRNTSFPEAAAALQDALGLREQVADLERVRRILHHVGGEAALRVPVIGHSFGGFIAALYAAEFPDVVAKLVLESPAAMLTLPMANTSDDTFAVLRALMPTAARREAFDAFVKEYTDFGNLFTKTEADLRKTNADFLAFYAEALKAAGRPLPPSLSGVKTFNAPDIGGWVGPGIFMSMGMFGWDVRSLLGRTVPPVLLIEGARDLVSSASYAQAYGDRASRVILDDVGHFSHDEAPEKWSEAVSKFLA